MDGRPPWRRPDAATRAEALKTGSTWLHPETFSRGIEGDGGAASFRNPTLACRTPRPWTFMCEAGLLACGSRHPSAFPRHLRPSGFVERMLAAYSCGGSSGLSRPSWPPRIPVLAFHPFESKEPRTLDIVECVNFASMARSISGQSNSTCRDRLWIAGMRAVIHRKQGTGRCIALSMAPAMGHGRSPPIDGGAAISGLRRAGCR